MSWLSYAGGPNGTTAPPILANDLIWTTASQEGGGEFNTFLYYMTTSGVVSTLSVAGSDGGSPTILAYDPVGEVIYGTYSDEHPSENCLYCSSTSPALAADTVVISDHTDDDSFSIIVNPSGGVAQLCVLTYYEIGFGRTPNIFTSQPPALSGSFVPQTPLDGGEFGYPVFDGTSVWAPFESSADSPYLLQIDPVAQSVLNTYTLPYVATGQTGFDGRYIYVPTASGVTVFDTTGATVVGTFGSGAVSACWYSANLGCVVTCDESPSGVDNTFNIYTMPTGGGSLTNIGDTWTITGEDNQSVVGFCDGPTGDLWASVQGSGFTYNIQFTGSITSGADPIVMIL